MRKVSKDKLIGVCCFLSYFYFFLSPSSLSHSLSFSFSLSHSHTHTYLECKHLKKTEKLLFVLNQLLVDCTVFIFSTTPQDILWSKFLEHIFLFILTCPLRGTFHHYPKKKILLIIFLIDANQLRCSWRLFTFIPLGVQRLGIYFITLKGQVQFSLFFCSSTFNKNHSRYTLRNFFTSSSSSCFYVFIHPQPTSLSFALFQNKLNLRTRNWEQKKYERNKNFAIFYHKYSKCNLIKLLWVAANQLQVSWNQRNGRLSRKCGFHLCQCLRLHHLSLHNIREL